jgi:cytochrome c-type biogenesis protein CcmH/NrfG
VNPAYVLAVVALLLAATVAVLLLRKGRDAAAFACLVAGPVLAALPIAFWPADGTGASTADPQAGLGTPAAATAAAPSTPAGAARARAEQARAARDWVAARDALAELTRLAPEDADAWADLADASAAAANGDLAAGESAFTRALAIDPNHVKGLWLQASLERQRGNYATAATLWERLIGLVPAGSDQAKVLAANLEEARSRVAGAR